MFLNCKLSVYSFSRSLLNRFNNTIFRGAKAERLSEMIAFKQLVQEENLSEERQGTTHRKLPFC